MQAVNKINVKQCKIDGDMLFKVLKISEKILTYDFLLRSGLCVVSLDFEMDICPLFCKIKKVWCFLSYNC
jgi:hypothetical protein